MAVVIPCLYARKETDPDHPTFHRVVLYRDSKATKLHSIFPAGMWKPDRRNKYVNLNCVTWPIIWLPDEL